MASGGHLLQQQGKKVRDHLDSLKNEDLKNICRAYNYQVSGTKAVLLDRCRQALSDIASKGDVVGFEDFKQRTHVTNLPSLTQNNSNLTPNSYTSPMYQPYNMPAQRGPAGMSQNRMQGGKQFKSNPFYEVLQSLLQMTDLPEGRHAEMPTHRNTVKSSFVIKPEVGQRLRTESDLKIMLFCGHSHAMSAYTPVNINFPNQIEVKVNNNDVKHNFKGLKNKDGSTKPADITSLLQKFGGQQNNVQITYALTQKRFSYTIYLVRYHTAEKLVERIKSGNVIPKDKVLRDMSKANADPDIAATSIRMSLKDPVSTVRITLPVRSSYCTHNQCFDGAMFLQLQEQAPQWSCPVCSKNVAFESLCIDKYFEDILNRTSKSIDKIDIEPDGNWTVIKEEEDSIQPNGTSNKARAAYDDDFDDLVELDEPTNKPVNGVRTGAAPVASPSPFALPSHAVNTPPISSREASVAQSASSSRAQKRPHSSVIDLTLSDEEDDDPPRPAKRQSTMQQRQSVGQSNSYDTPNSLPEPQIQQMPQQNHAFGQASNFRPSSSHHQQPSFSFNNNNNTNPNYNPTNSYGSHSPASLAGSPFGQQSYPAWPQHSYSRSTTQQPPSMLPHPKSPFAARPASTSAPDYNQQNATDAYNNGLRLPPMQMQQASPLRSPDAANMHLYAGYRHAAERDFDLGNYDSSSPG